MRRLTHTPAKVAAGFFVAALSALPQYTISAKPGVINTIEGTAYVNGKHVTDEKAADRMFLNANDTLSTDAGKAEVLLTPGVFLRLGDHSEIKMISPTLTDTKVELTKGEAMVEVAEILKENDVEIAVAGANAKIEKIGLYKFTASNPPTASVFEGKVTVESGDKTVGLGKDHQAVLTGQLKAEHFKAKDDQTDLYAWSKTRDEYNSASSYASAKSLAANGYSGGGGWGYGFSGFNVGAGPGWMWNSMFNSYSWLPGNGAYFSPFGYGYFAPGYVGYAPVVYSSFNGLNRGGGGVAVAVPVNPGHMPASVGTNSRPVAMTASGTPYRGTPVAHAMTGRVGAQGGYVPANSFSGPRGVGQARAASASGGNGGAGYARSASSGVSAARSAGSGMGASSGARASSGGSAPAGHR